MKSQFVDGRNLFLWQSLLPLPELLEECDSKVVTLIVMCAFDVEFGPLPELLVDSVEIHDLFLEREPIILLLELTMEPKLPSIGSGTSSAANSGRVI